MSMKSMFTVVLALIIGASLFVLGVADGMKTQVRKERKAGIIAICGTRHVNGQGVVTSNYTAVVFADGTRHVQHHEVNIPEEALED